MQVTIDAWFQNTAANVFTEVIEGAPMRLTAKVPAALVALFPKSAGFKANGYMDARLGSDIHVGEKNEAGINRYRALARTADKHGIELVFAPSCTNGYTSREQFEAAIA